MSAVHLILGLIALGNGIPYNLLTKSGLSVQSVENFLSSRRALEEESTVCDGVSFGNSALVAFERAEAFGKNEA